MNPEAQRIAIAEACGWRVEIRKSQDGIEWTALISPSGKPHDTTSGNADLGNFGCIPDYPADLNAMHEAIGTLDFYSLLLCADWLIKICNPNHDRLVKEFTDHERARAINATAAQRAEAFLRTIGKWEDGK